MSQAFINNASGFASTCGVLLNGLDLKAFHRPDSTRSDLTLLVSKWTYSSLSEISISIDKNFLLSPLLISLTIPPAGDVKKTPGFFLSSKILVPLFTESPNLTNIVGFMPVKSLPNIDTDVTLGVSVIKESGIPEIGKSRPLEIFITCA